MFLFAIICALFANLRELRFIESDFRATNYYLNLNFDTLLPLPLPP